MCKGSGKFQWCLTDKRPGVDVHVESGRAKVPHLLASRKNTAARKAPLADYRPVIAKGCKIHAAFADKACRWLDHVASSACSISQWLPNKWKLHKNHHDPALRHFDHWKKSVSLRESPRFALVCCLSGASSPESSQAGHVSNQGLSGPKRGLSILHRFSTTLHADER